MWKYRKRFSKLLLIVFLISVVFACMSSMLFCDHECMGEDCGICYEINLMKNICDNLLLLSVIYTFIGEEQYYTRHKKERCSVNYRLTPVELRVKITE